MSEVLDGAEDRGWYGTPSRWRGRMVWRLLPEGLAAACFVVALVGVGVWVGNNLVVLTASALASVALVGEAVAWSATRALEVRRELPGEAWVGKAARGSIRVVCHSRWFGIGDLRVAEPDGLGRAGVGIVPARTEVVASARWRFPDRGAVRLEGLRLRSSWPFRLLEREVVVDVNDELVVYPDVGVAGMPARGPSIGGHRRRAEGVEIQDLRAWRAEEPLRAVHWPTSARVRSPIVVVREAEGDDAVLVEVPPVRGEAWELAIRDAAAAVVEAWLAGRDVGLSIGGRVLPPQGGAAWRRTLLAVLATAERR